MRFNLIVIGGGAAGFFAALAAKKRNPDSTVLVLEKTNALLSKVRVSGGGRCNLTHACFDPLQLVRNYPRGNKALIGPFTRFQPRDTFEWFESRGVDLKVEADGRVFPKSDSSQTVIDCLLKEAGRLGVEIRLKQSIEHIQWVSNALEDCFSVELADGRMLESHSLLLATGGHPQGYAFAKSLNHTIQPPVPSLFTFNVPSSPFTDLAGIAVDRVNVHLVDTNFTQTGPLLITHWGFSGPAILKLSAWGARFLNAANYQVTLAIDWLPDFSRDQMMEALCAMRKNSPMQSVVGNNPFNLPKNLWKRVIELLGVDGKKRYSETNNEFFSKLNCRLKSDPYKVEGKTTNKEEFVTCGGITLDEVNFKTMESRLCKGLFFAGEILDIDGVTGGFNFQSAWTTGWLAGNHCELL